MEIPKLITILGPTAVGKTRFAALLANKINGEIISADSRQVYKGMDIGTGKDLNDYVVNDVKIPYHLIDIKDPVTDDYSVYDFKLDFIKVCNEIINRQKQPILCGGTGFYIDAVLSDYSFSPVGKNEKLRKELLKLSVEELANRVKKFKVITNPQDLKNRHRLIRYIEIHEQSKQKNNKIESIKIEKSIVLGIFFERETLKERISKRLKERLKQGMIEEVQKLLDNGVSYEKLLNFGLEYKYIALFLLKVINFEEMYEQLEKSICQFAKRQMTWFRRMERLGCKINWIDGSLDNEKKLEKALEIIESY